MKQLYKHLLSAATVIAFLVIAMASANVKNSSPTEEGGLIPPGFGNAGETLLVIKSDIFGNANHTIRKKFGTYTGTYKIVEWKEVSSYRIDGYRYSFELVQNPSAFSSPGHRGAGTVSCMITDRQTQKEYKANGTAFYGKQLTAYIEAMNKIIQKR